MKRANAKNAPKCCFFRQNSWSTSPNTGLTVCFCTVLEQSCIALVRHLVVVDIFIKNKQYIDLIHLNYFLHLKSAFLLA
jgi:hypothetical protein